MHHHCCCAGRQRPRGRRPQACQGRIQLPADQREEKPEFGAYSTRLGRGPPCQQVQHRFLCSQAAPTEVSRSAASAVHFGDGTPRSSIAPQDREQFGQPASRPLASWRARHPWCGSRATPGSTTTAPGTGRSLPHNFTIISSPFHLALYFQSNTMLI